MAAQDVRAGRDASGAGAFTLATALGLLAAPTGVFVLSTVWLLLGGRLNAPVAILILAAAGLGALGVAWRVHARWTAPALVAALVVASAVVSGQFVDTSFDGQQYHYDAAVALAEGWNPHYEAYAPPEAQRDYVQPQLWPAHYPQAAWRVMATEMAAGLGAETAKGVAIVFALALFFAAWSLAQRMELDPRLAVALALVAAANPVIIAQLLTRMNDGLLAACLGLTGVFAALWLTTKSRWSLLGVVAPIAFGLNLKFSAIPHLVLLCGLIVGLAWLAARRAAALRFAVAAMAAGVIGVAVLGAHPYVTNTIGHGHPLYPLMGAESVDIISEQRPDAIEALNPVQRIAASYLSPTSSGYDGAEGLKIPFVIERTEVRAAGGVDARLAGFGPWFSGALLITLALLAGMAARRRFAPEMRVALLAGGGLFVMSMIFPEAWWARYVPQFWWVPLLVAVAALMSDNLRLRQGGLALTAVLTLNATFVGGSMLLGHVRDTLGVRNQLAAMAALAPPVRVNLGSSHARLPLMERAGLEVAPFKLPFPPDCEPVELVGAFSVTNAPPNPAYCGPAEE